VNKFRYVIVDDEPKAATRLKNKMEQLYPDSEMAGVYHFWVPALDALRNSEFDILFLDISMPQKNGFDLLELVPELRCEVIFVTAHEEHALDAFNFAATGYILKPINDILLIKAVDKAIQRVQNALSKKTILNKVERTNNIIGIHNNKGVDYISTDDIVYLEATSRYTKIVTTKITYLSSYSIGKFKDLLQSNNFYQVHRSYIINLHQVKRYESTGTVILKNGLELPVSRNLREGFLSLFENI
jgi:two-component system, LytTR family, response regulator